MPNTTLSRAGHIIYPDVEVGAKTLALCGVKVKVKTKDIPFDHYTCRDCVDEAITLLDEACDLLYANAATAQFVDRMLREMVEDNLGSNAALQVETGQAYADRQVEKAEAKQAAKAEAKAAKKKKGKKDDRPPVAPPLD